MKFLVRFNDMKNIWGNLKDNLKLKALMQIISGSDNELIY